MYMKEHLWQTQWVQQLSAMSDASKQRTAHLQSCCWHPEGVWLLKRYHGRRLQHRGGRPAAGGKSPLHVGTTLPTFTPMCHI